MKNFKVFLAETKSESVNEGYIRPDHPDWSKNVQDAATRYVAYRKGYNAGGKKGEPISHKRVMNDILYNSYQNVPNKHWDAFAKAVMKHQTVKQSGLKEDINEAKSSGLNK